MPKAARANIAICYDFDGTLIRGNMQENSFLPDIGISAEEFWSLVKKKATSTTWMKCSRTCT